MRILFITTSFNSMAQRAWVELDRLNHQVKVHLAHKNIEDAVKEYEPDLIIAPYLKTAIPEIIWRKCTCLVIHPGIPGDRGSCSLDWAILNNEKEWGVTILQASGKMDAGPVWATCAFTLRNVSKSCLYRREVTQAAMQGLLSAVQRFENKDYVPRAFDEIKTTSRGKWQRATNENDFRFSWGEETASIIRKINAADSYPGALCNILSDEYFCYGAVAEDMLIGSPGEILAQRHDAVCIATNDSALWIQCLKKNETGYIKLPATIALGERVKNIPESNFGAFEGNPHINTFREIRYEEDNDVGYVHFDFYNGAMSTAQCNRLKDVFTAVRKRHTKVIVLMGGEDMWSNGIHLNLIESSANPAQTSWDNINAMDDLIREIICTETHFIIAAMQGNAGAGGVALALAADKVVARRGIVFNPHTRNMGLYGSEYWTYLLPKRIGTQKANLFTEQCLPWGTDIALEVKLVDACLRADTEYTGNMCEVFRQKVKKMAEEISQLSYFPQLLAAKKFKRNRDESYKPLKQYRDEELKEMHKNFFEDNWGYDYKRYCFVHKINEEEKKDAIADKDLFSERRKIWRRRKYEKVFYES